MRARIVAMFTVPTVEGSAREASRSPAGETAVAGFAENAWVSMARALARALARVVATPTPFSTETLLSLIASFDKLTRLANFFGVRGCCTNRIRRTWTDAAGSPR
jgi:hypothetical protein